MHFPLLFTSNMDDTHKNISGILEAFKNSLKRHPDIRLELIGGEAETYRDKAQNMGIPQENISFINQLPHKDVIAHLQQAKALILFSRYENLPVLFLEAFATGTPVISSDVGGIHEYFPEDFGTLISANCIKSLTNEINAFVDGNKKTATAEAMHKYVEREFSAERLAESFQLLYIDALK